MAKVFSVKTYDNKYYANILKNYKEYTNEEIFCALDNYKKTSKYIKYAELMNIAIFAEHIPTIEFMLKRKNVNYYDQFIFAYKQKKWEMLKIMIDSNYLYTIGVNDDFIENVIIDYDIHDKFLNIIVANDMDIDIFTIRCIMPIYLYEYKYKYYSELIKKYIEINNISESIISAMKWNNIRNDDISLVIIDVFIENGVDFTIEDYYYTKVFMQYYQNKVLTGNNKEKKYFGNKLNLLTSITGKEYYTKYNGDVDELVDKFIQLDPYINKKTHNLCICEIGSIIKFILTNYDKMLNIYSTK